MTVTSKKVTAGDEIKAAGHNALVDDVTALDADLGQKADKTYVDKELGKKANSSSLSGKANTSDLEALEARIAALESPAGEG